MGFSSLHVCMESSDHWLQGTIHEESGMDSSSPSGDMLTCSRPLIDQRRLIRSPHDPAQKCPRCDSTHTKFCYYNNYSLSQPRYFCKTCRRYWTKGGTLRNIPVGGGCRKNKKVSAKKSNDQPQPGPSYHHNPKDIQHSSFPDHMPFSHPNNLLGTNIGALGNPDFMESRYNIGMVENPRPIEFMEGKFEGIIGSSSRNFDVMGNSDMGVVINGPNGYGICSPAFGGIDGNNSGTYTLDSCQRLMLPYDANVVQNAAIHDVKPNPKLLSLDWQDQGCSDAGKESFGYVNGLGSWTGMMNGYGSSTTNPLV